MCRKRMITKRCLDDLESMHVRVTFSIVVSSRSYDTNVDLFFSLPSFIVIRLSSFSELPTSSRSYKKILFPHFFSLLTFKSYIYFQFLWNKNNFVSFHEVLFYCNYFQSIGKVYEMWCVFNYSERWIRKKLIVSLGFQSLIW